MIMEKERVVLLRLGEIALKGLNRRRFEEHLIRNLAKQVKHHARYEVLKRDGRIYIEPVLLPGEILGERELQERLEYAMTAASRVFGIVSYSPVSKIPVDEEAMIEEAIHIAKRQRERGKLRFKVEAKRSDKSFRMNSPQIASFVGEKILEACPDLHVDVHHPDFVLWVEVREKMYLYSEIFKGRRGLPVGSAAKAMVLLSGGIDSPVAAYRMASRGCPLEAIYFHTFPYTSDRAKEKVFDLATIVSRYTGNVTLHVVDFTDIQLRLNEACPEEMMTLVMRRMMMRIAEAQALRRECKGLVTGESLGQVASQTMEALASTNEVATLPVFRPLIGTDKDETIALAREIESFETSILPYDDCCTVFVAKHPSTRPRPEKVRQAEAKLDIPELVSEGVSKIRSYDVRPWRISEIKAGEEGELSAK